MIRSIVLCLLLSLVSSCSTSEEEVSNLGGKVPIICYETLPNIELCRDKTGVLWLCQDAYKDKFCDKFESIAKTFEVTRTEQVDASP